MTELNSFLDFHMDSVCSVLKSARVAALLNKKLVKDKLFHLDVLDKMEVWALSMLLAKLLHRSCLPFWEHVDHIGLTQTFELRNVEASCSKTNGKDLQSRWVLVLMAKPGWNGIQNDSWWVPGCHMSRQLAKTVSRKISVSCPHGSWRVKWDHRHDWRVWKPPRVQ